MKTIIIGAGVFDLQYNYMDSSHPNDNFSVGGNLLIQSIITPSPITMFSWVKFVLDQLKGEKHIVSAIMSFGLDTMTPASAVLKLTEPAGPQLNPAVLCYSNAPAGIDVGLPPVTIVTSDTIVNFDITKVITDMVEGRRENKGFYIKVVPKVPAVNTDIAMMKSIAELSGPAVLTVIIDPTVKPPSRKR
jgi:hypothetical protein